MRAGVEHGVRVVFVASRRAMADSAKVLGATARLSLMTPRCWTITHGTHLHPAGLDQSPALESVHLSSDHYVE
jgi:hypothetical protein